jgi:hypothetical protein
VIGLFAGGASAHAARAAGSTARTSGAGWTFGAAASTSGDVMVGAGPAPMPAAQHCREYEEQSEAVVDRETGFHS